MVSIIKIYNGATYFYSFLGKAINLRVNDIGFHP
jgi:hypothetical protein